MFFILRKKKKKFIFATARFSDWTLIQAYTFLSDFRVCRVFGPASQRSM